MYTDGETNAGFHFSIPLPGNKRSRHAVRVMLPDYFAFQYDMRSGNEFVWGIERSGFFNGREKWAKGFENQRV